MIARSRTSTRPATQARSHTEFVAADHHFPQLWFLVVSLTVFAVYVAWDLGLFSIVFTLDRSHITMVIAGLVVLASCHAAWHIFRFSQRIMSASRRLAAEPYRHDADEPDAFLHEFLTDLSGTSSTHASNPKSNNSDAILEIYADRLRSPVDLGWFLVDLAIRLGLVGTIIGFILIFTSLSGSSIDGAEGLKQLLVAMSGGMGTALFTTLAGLVAATFMSFQYLILGREIEGLVVLLVRIRNRFEQTRPG